jgi:hypothetical protein
MRAWLQYSGIVALLSLCGNEALFAQTTCTAHFRFPLPPGKYFTRPYSGIGSSEKEALANAQRKCANTERRINKSQYCRRIDSSTCKSVEGERKSPLVCNGGGARQEKRQGIELRIPWKDPGRGTKVESESIGEVCVTVPSNRQAVSLHCREKSNDVWSWCKYTNDSSGCSYTISKAMMVSGPKDGPQRYCWFPYNEADHRREFQLFARVKRK